MKTLFYTLDEVQEEVINTIEKNINFIDILAPQCYKMDSTGIISGKIDSKLLETAKKYDKKVMPLIINSNFNQESFHQFLNSAHLHEAAIQIMLQFCQENKLYGLQFDFENINISDKQHYMDFYKRTASVLHQNHFAISIAVVPSITIPTADTSYEKWMVRNWRGVFDYKLLAECSDFISLMTYDQHTPRTPPGPVAGLPWVRKCIYYALQYLKPEQVSLGIPTYSRYWYPNADGQEVRMKAESPSYARIQRIIKEHNLKLIWDANEMVNYGSFQNCGVNEYIYLEDADSFKAKLSLASEHRLHGISVWRLGVEDARIWSTFS